MSISAIDINSSITLPAITTSQEENTQNFSKALTQAIESTSISLLSTHENALAYRPDMKTFMDATGVDASIASELIYGVVGSNTDTRNWQAIMSSSDPITSARQATAAMYGLNITAPVETPALDDHTLVIKSSEHFELLQHTNDENVVDHESLMLTTSNGSYLRNAGTTTEQILHNAWVFGFSVTELKDFSTTTFNRKNKSNHTQPTI